MSAPLVELHTRSQEAGEPRREGLSDVDIRALCSAIMSAIVALGASGDSSPPWAIGSTVHDLREALLAGRP
jgi:hypothetical protein